MPKPLIALTVMPVLLLLGCASPKAGTHSPVAAEQRTASGTSCPAGGRSRDSSRRPAEAVGTGPPPAAPTSVDLIAGPRGDQATVRVHAPAGASYDAVQLRVFVNGCPVPYTDEGDELPTNTLSGLHHGDVVRVLARLDGEGGNSAETPSTRISIP